MRGLADYLMLQTNKIWRLLTKLKPLSLLLCGRSLHFYCRPLYLKDIHNFRYNSENEFIMITISLRLLAGILKGVIASECIKLGKLTKRSKHYFRFCSKKDERSLFHLGQIVIRQRCEFLDIGLRFKISAAKLFSLNKGLSSDYR